MSQFFIVLVILPTFFFCSFKASFASAPKDCSKAFDTYEKAASFERVLTPVDLAYFDVVVPIQIQSQCKNSCSITAQMMTVNQLITVHFGYDSKLSTAWTEMTSFYVQFLEVLAKESRLPFLIYTITQENLRKAVSEFGVMLESAFPQNPNVNTIELVKRLNEIIDDVNQNRIQTHKQAIEKAKKVLAMAFNPTIGEQRFPNDKELNEAKNFASQLAIALGVASIDRLFLRTPVIIKIFESEKEKLNRERAFIIREIFTELKANRPLQISYSHEGNDFISESGRYTTPSYSDNQKIFGNGHLATIVGIKMISEKDFELLIANSHDEAPYLIMPSDYFWQYANEIYTNQMLFGFWENITKATQFKRWKNFENQPPAYLNLNEQKIEEIKQAILQESFNFKRQIAFKLKSVNQPAISGSVLRLTSFHALVRYDHVEYWVPLYMIDKSSIQSL